MHNNTEKNDKRALNCLINWWDALETIIESGSVFVVEDIKKLEKLENIWRKMTRIL